MRRTVLAGLLKLIVQLFLGLLGSSIDLLGSSIDIPLYLLLDLLGLLIELLATFLVVEPLFVPCAAGQLLGHLIDSSFDVLLGWFPLRQGFCRGRTLRRLIDLALKRLQLVLQLIELFFGVTDLLASQSGHGIG